MGSQPKASDLGRHVSHVVALDGTDAAQPAYDSEEPVDDPHESHEWVLYDRWAECSVCHCRDYWPGASDRCLAVQSAGGMTDVEWRSHLDREVEAFLAWWRAKDLGGTRPDANEWFAELAEWRRERGTRKKKGPYR